MNKFKKINEIELQNTIGGKSLWAHTKDAIGSFFNGIKDGFTGK